MTNIGKPYEGKPHVRFDEEGQNFLPFTLALFQRHLMDEGSRRTLYALLMVGVIFSFAVSNINWMGHLGGLIGGFFIYGLLIRVLKRR
nr:rhomboid family intramembrane serine protease [Paenibacillus caui]